MQSRSLTTALLIIAALIGWAAQAGSPAPEPTFTVSFPGGLSPAGPLDGRVILLLSRDLKREPRSHVSPNEPLASPYLFGLTVDGLAVGHAAVIDHRAFGWPAARLSAVPAGEYLVQAVLNRYETYHLADGRILKLPPDKGEGQQWAHKPGNLYSKPVRMHLDPAHPARRSLVLDQEIPPIEPKTDTPFVSTSLRSGSRRCSRPTAAKCCMATAPSIAGMAIPSCRTRTRVCITTCSIYRRSWSASLRLRLPVRI
jgi:hypothetical protein